MNDKKDTTVINRMHFLPKELVGVIAEYLTPKEAALFSSTSKEQRDDCEYVVKKHTLRRELFCKVIGRNLRDFQGEFPLLIEGVNVEEPKKEYLRNINMLLGVGNIDLRLLPQDKISILTAMSVKNPDTVQAMIDGGIALSQLVNGYGLNILHHAAMNGSNKAVQVIKLAVQNGMKDKVDDADNGEQRSPIHYASIRESSSNALTALIEAEADLDKQDISNNTALYIASMNGNIKGARCLLVAGADINKKCNGGAVAIAVACGEDMVNLLNEYNPKIEIENDRGENPLFESVYAPRRREIMAEMDDIILYGSEDSNDIEDVDPKGYSVVGNEPEVFQSSNVRVKPKAVTLSNSDRVYLANDSELHREEVEEASDNNNSRVRVEPSSSIGIMPAIRNFIVRRFWGNVPKGTVIPTNSEQVSSSDEEITK